MLDDNKKGGPGRDRGGGHGRQGWSEVERGVERDTLPRERGEVVGLFAGKAGEGDD